MAAGRVFLHIKDGMVVGDRKVHLNGGTPEEQAAWWKQIEDNPEFVEVTDDAMAAWSGGASLNMRSVNDASMARVKAEFDRKQAARIAKVEQGR